MNKGSTFRLSFHIFHPKMSALEVESVLQMPIRFSQSVGDRRKTKSGKALSGDYKDTNVSFSLHESPLSFDDASVAIVIKETVKLLDFNLLSRLIETGGRCNFLLGVFSSSSVMFEIDEDVTRLLGDSRIGIKFDFYGGED